MRESDLRRAGKPPVCVRENELDLEGGGRMSTVLQFRSPAGSGAERAFRRERACEIVIFPGVRIERHAEPEFFEAAGALLDADAAEVDAPVPQRR